MYNTFYAGRMGGGGGGSAMVFAHIYSYLFLLAYQLILQGPPVGVQSHLYISAKGISSGIRNCKIARWQKR